MDVSDRRHFLRKAAGSIGAATAFSAFSPALRQAMALEPRRVTGTIQDVDHIVVLTQENRSFDHYFGAMRGVRGFADRFAVPMAAPDGAAPGTVWRQPRAQHPAPASVVLPFHLDTQQNFALMRAEGTPHSWQDAQQAWDHGRLSRWTQAKGQHAMAYYRQADLPFHYALADAFTVCDAYHCSFQGGTNTNRLFLWTGTNDPRGQGNGPATYNDLDSLHARPGLPGYTWVTYAERLQAAGITWQVYQDMADNFDDNPLAGFQRFRDAHSGRPGALTELATRGLSTYDLDRFKADVQASQLPQVSWIVAGAQESEHPEKSSPAQGAHYTSRVLEALASNPQVWSRTVLILNFDENDGFFDHMPPPAAPSYARWHPDPAQAALAGGSTVDTRDEYHEQLSADHNTQSEQALLHHVYGLGPRVPMLVISPWSRGGWVNSQVFDHTSVIRFMEQRFGVIEPNISAWRRAVCGDLTSTLDFTHANQSPLPELPATRAPADRARALSQRLLPVLPVAPSMPRQAPGTRPSRALPYQLQVHSIVDPAAPALELQFVNSGAVGAVFHVYDRMNLKQIPRRYTVEAGKRLTGGWSLSRPAGAYDLWVLGPNGFHRHLMGREKPELSPRGPVAEVEVGYDLASGALTARLRNGGSTPCTFELTTNAYGKAGLVRRRVPAQQEAVHRWALQDSAYWYDFTVRVAGLPGFARRFAGRMETGSASTSDPALG